MAEVKKVATRVSYGEALVELGNEHDDFVVAPMPTWLPLRRRVSLRLLTPERFYDAGIAESNLMGLAAGHRDHGRVAFASTFAMFAAGRAYEQVRNSIGYPHLNVKIGATHAGISVGEDGRHAPVLRGYRTHAHDSGYDGGRSRRRRRGSCLCARRL